MQQLRPYDSLRLMNAGYNQYGIPINQAPLNPYLSTSAPSNSYLKPVQPPAAQQSQQPSGGGFSNLPWSKVASNKLTQPFFSNGLTQGIDQFAFNNFGIGQSVADANAVLGMPNLSDDIASSTFSGQKGLTSTFNPANAIGGFAGNFLGNSLFGDDRGIGADIGGAVGGIAGGVAAGTAIGQALIPIPGVGAAIGALAGNALGGLFGGSQPNPFSTWNNYDENNKSLYNPDGTLKGQADLQSKHMGGDFGSQMANQVMGINQRVHQLTGMDMSQIKNITGYEKNYGGFITLNSPFHKDPSTYNPDNAFYFDVNNPEDQQRALQDYTRRLVEYGNPNMSPEEINAVVQQAIAQPQQQQGGFQNSVGMPMIAEKSGQGNESYAAFMKRYRDEGATTPIMGRNTRYENQGAPSVPA